MSKERVLFDSIEIAIKIATAGLWGQREKVSREELELYLLFARLQSCFLKKLEKK